MPTIQCEQCGLENDEFILYCKACGHYLHRKDKNKNRRVWTPTTKAAVQKNEIEYYVICPQCKEKIRTAKDSLPWACMECGYVFRAGVDKILADNDDAKDNKERQITPPDGTTGEVIQQTGGTGSALRRSPMPSVRMAETILRLIALDVSMPPIELSPDGNVLGKDGMIAALANSPHCVFVWRKAGFWYARSEAGQPYINGEHMMKNLERMLGDGDKLTFDRINFRIEIVRQ